MKIKPEHIEHMNKAIAPVMKQYPVEGYLQDGLTAKRWRWDLTRAAKLTHWICDTLYKYANDDHIDTALRHITGTK